MPYISLNKPFSVVDDESKEIIAEPDRHTWDWVKTLIDTLATIVGIAAIPFTGGWSAVAVDATIGAINAGIDAAIDAAQGNTDEIGYEFIGLIAAPLSAGAGSLVKTGLLSRSAFKYLVKRGFQAVVKLGETGAGLQKGAFSFVLDDVRNNSIKKFIAQNIKFANDIQDLGGEISTKYGRDLIHEVEIISSNAQKLVDRLGELEVSIRNGVVTKLTIGYVFKWIRRQLVSYLVSLSKLYAILSNPINEAVNLVFKSINRFLSKVGYFRNLRILEERVLNKWLKGNKYVLSKIDAVAMKSFNLLPLDSEWLLGCRLLQHHRTPADSNMEWPPSDLQIMFQAAATQHFGERGAQPEPWGKRAITVKNISKLEYEAFINAPSKGRFYLDTWAYSKNIHTGWDHNTLSTLIDVIPGLAIVNQARNVYEQTKRFINFQFKPSFPLLTVSKIINKFARLVPFRHVRFVIREITYQVYHPSPSHLTIDIARDLSIRYGRSSSATNTRGGNFQIYKAHKAKLQRARKLRAQRP